MIYGAESRPWQGHGTQRTLPCKHRPLQENSGDGGHGNDEDVHKTLGVVGAGGGALRLCIQNTR